MESKCIWLGIIQIDLFLESLIEGFSCCHRWKINKIGNSTYNGAFYANLDLKVGFGSCEMTRKTLGRKMERKCLGLIYIFPSILFNIFLMNNLNLKMYELLNNFILLCVHFYFILFEVASCSSFLFMLNFSFYLGLLSTLLFFSCYLFHSI